MTLQINSTSLKQTEEIAEKIGSNLKGGEIIELISDLGGGKTTFVKGIAKGAKSKDHVSSPTFTLEQIYQTNNFNIHHFDFYRLGNNPGLVTHELVDAMEVDSNVIIIEWAQHIRHVLPEKILQINMTYSKNDTRKININYPDSLKYVLEHLC